MEPLFSRQFREDIQKDYEKAMKLYPKKKQEADEFLKTITDSEKRTAFQYLYTFMPAADRITYSVAFIFEFVQMSWKAREDIPYAEHIPAELFLAYVLHYRINNENIDTHRISFYEELLPRIQGKSMKEAILEVNYWCYEKATYIPTDDRTISPIHMIKAAKGRCGEESTLAVAALRTVGIPARQCYVPRWAHCDDNHAWVEAWADGKWYYLGACEPEPVLNKGWFTAAASKSMLVHSKAFSSYIIEEGNRQESPLFELVNSTKNYGKCKNIIVAIQENGIVQPNISVRFELINYSELYPIYTAITDINGTVSFITGYGDIYIEAYKDGKLLGYKFDVRKEDQITLDFSRQDAIFPMELEGVIEQDFDMVPPTEKIEENSFLDETLIKAHQKRLSLCEEIRSSYEQSFFTSSAKRKTADYYKTLAKGNRKEIEAFFEIPSFSIEDKLDLLSTLHEKDLIDITKDTLSEYLQEALPWKGNYPKEIFRDYVLAPRIQNEMILQNRTKIREFFEQLRRKGEYFTDALDVWEYLKKTIQIKEEYGCENLSLDSYGAIFYQMCTKSYFPVLFVSVCRALGIAACINPVTQLPEYIEIQKDNTIQFFPFVKSADAKETAVCLTIQNNAEKPLKYETDFTIGYFQDGIYQTLQYKNFLIEDNVSLSLLPGSYRIVTSARQIDGAVLAKTYYFHTDNTRFCEINLAQDKTREKLKEIPIKDISIEQTSLYQECKENYSVILFAEPGKEPTEHLFQELLEHKKEYEKLHCPILIFISDVSAMQNVTLQKVLSELSYSKVFLFDNKEYLYHLHVQMQVGDERFPFALVLSPEKKGLFAFANYNIGTAQTILSIIKIHENMKNNEI